ncbi:hypothetical protein [Streptomyces peucetius]|nr:hypothetical protein CGZ69_23975 [Streptomyces peucetius subsp. caesius ATCC 27952]
MPGPDDATLDISPGIGLYLLVAGVLAVLAGGAAAPANRLWDLIALRRRVLRLWDRGLGFEAAGLQQKLLRRMRRTPGLDGRALVIETLHLAGLYVDCGLPQRGAELVRRTMADALAVLADGPEALASAQALAAENMSLARTVSQQQMAMGAGDSRTAHAHAADAAAWPLPAAVSAAGVRPAAVLSGALPRRPAPGVVGRPVSFGRWGLDGAGVEPSRRGVDHSFERDAWHSSWLGWICQADSVAWEQP